jgi:hypothetical protein
MNAGLHERMRALARLLFLDLENLQPQPWSKAMLQL